jgi:hypothetical protein
VEVLGVAVLAKGSLGLARRMALLSTGPAAALRGSKTGQLLPLKKSSKAKKSSTRRQVALVAAAYPKLRRLEAAVRL